MSAQTTPTVTTPSGRIVRIRVSPVGQHFGYVARVSARNGRVIHETDVYGSAEGARRTAMQWASEAGR